MRNYKQLFPNLDLEDDQEKFLDYIDTKGVFLHKHVYDAFMSFKMKVTYKELSQYIIYDKGIRNVLYKYLGALEEYYRSKLINNYDIEEKLFDPENAKIGTNIIVKSRNNSSNLYEYSFSKNFTFSNLLRILNELGILSKKEKAELNDIRNFRNKVMHHNLIVIGLFISKAEINKNITYIENMCELIYDYLPIQMKTPFEKAINTCNHITLHNKVPNLDVMCLGVMINGVFIKDEKQTI